MSARETGTWQRNSGDRLSKCHLKAIFGSGLNCNAKTKDQGSHCTDQV